ncbi:MAG: Rieske 2Fe-2S domain-containing protein [Armatimonadota bacterium]|nr:Rieske 2Fe-2S domain-containing protein [Armatimonadota bacterium]MDR7449080.1 Rieske 2Fe-2S domain-containing protein [Armatimonadota bacterium]MDR7459160.1 Rieske 2Fe-2S domain-containing protein [Armatimonadota bacterium]MDR7480432.1 Rieske 2Fe-2S domain-containing protein [Armatimonadota bacterium]MDR7489379.1 Rieske 2Fe-2S domain-containing protein [Armatimonadota bacterium]
MVERPERLARRGFLRLVTAVPIVAAAAAFLSPLLRLLKPNTRPFEVLYEPTVHDVPVGEVTVAATLDEVARPWDFKYFVFTQRYPQYTPEGLRAANVPAVVIRLPYKIRLPWDWARTIGKTPQLQESDIIVFSRICPHLGCIYNYVPNWQEVTAGYGGYVPPPPRRHALMACPCHLSIYDPADPQQPGRVLSGPAPRPPRTFLYEIRGHQIVVTDVEPGGIA